MKKKKNGFENLLKDSWQKELDENVGDLNKNILDAEIPKVSEVSKVEKVGFWDKAMAFFKNYKKSVAATLVMSMCLIVVLSVVFTVNSVKPVVPETDGPGNDIGNLPDDNPGGEPSVKPDVPTPTPPTPGETSSSMAVKVDINPSVTFLCDGDGKVEKVVSMNRDGDVVLQDSDFSSAVLGLELDSAVVKFVDTAAKLGYFKLDSDAVKITLPEGKKLDEKVSTLDKSLRDYFMGKGSYSVVAFDFIGDDAFAALFGTSADEIISTVKGLKEKYFERVVSSNSDLSKLYSELVSFDRINAYLKSCIEENVLFVAEGLHLLGEISTLNQTIKYHIQNPSTILNKDYFELKLGDYEGKYSEVFKALMDEMELKLVHFENDYGVKISTSEELTTLKLKYSFINIDKGLNELSDFIRDYLNSGLVEYLGSIFDLIKQKYDYEVELLLEIPDNINDFILKMQKYTSLQKESKAHEFKADYEKARDAISSSEYGSYEEKIISEYGSLLNYFESQK